MKYATSSLTFFLDEQGPPYYQQLISQIQQGVETGRLSQGDKLPSSRLLAESLGVSRSTTTRVYDQLISEGLLISEPKRGVFVSSLLVSSPRKASSNNPRTSPIKAYPSQAMLSFDAGVDVSVFPNKEWAASMRRSWLKPDIAVLQGGYATGYPPLKEALVDYLYRVRGLECAPEQVVITAGNRDSLILLQHLFSGLSQSRRSQVSWWLESPTYPPIRKVFEQFDSPRTLEIDDHGPTLPSKQDAFNVGVMTPNNQYPLGTSMSSQRRLAWLQKLKQPEASWWLVEDDYDNEFVYQGRNEVPFMQMAQLDDTAKERVFFVGSFSKVLFRGLRLGFIVAPMSQIDRLQKSQHTLGSSASLPIQPAVADFMLQGNFDRHINRMRRHYRFKREKLLALLKSHLSKWFEWRKPRSGMHVLVEFKDAYCTKTREPLDQSMAKVLRKAGLKLSCLSTHYSEQSAIRQGFILGFSGTHEAAMEQCIQQMHDWLKENV
ncbi:MocR-like pyridoxine biosynthesis transcription factor PdxR [Marinomonas sp.]